MTFKKNKLAMEGRGRKDKSSVHEIMFSSRDYLTLV